MMGCYQRLGGGDSCFSIHSFGYSLFGAILCGVSDCLSQHHVYSVGESEDRKSEVNHLLEIHH